MNNTDLEIDIEMERQSNKRQRDGKLIRCNAAVGEAEFHQFYQREESSCTLTKCNALIGVDAFTAYFEGIKIKEPFPEIDLKMERQSNKRQRDDKLIRCNAVVGEAEFHQFYQRQESSCTLARCNALIGVDAFNAYFEEIKIKEPFSEIGKLEDQQNEAVLESRENFDNHYGSPQKRVGENEKPLTKEAEVDDDERSANVVDRVVSGRSKKLLVSTERAQALERITKMEMEVQKWNKVFGTSYTLRR